MWKFYIILAICYIVTAVVFYSVLWGAFSYIEYLLEKKRKKHTRKTLVGAFSIYTEKKYKAVSKSDTERAVYSNCAFPTVQCIYQSVDSLIR